MNWAIGSWIIYCSERLRIQHNMLARWVMRDYYIITIKPHTAYYFVYMDTKTNTPTFEIRFLDLLSPLVQLEENPRGVKKCNVNVEVKVMLYICLIHRPCWVSPESNQPQHLFTMFGTSVQRSSQLVTLLIYHALPYYIGAKCARI